MSRLISNKLGKVEVRVLLFCFISFLVVSLGLNLVNRNSIEHTARAQAGDAYVETDQVDYSAGDMAEIFGSGWEPGESVALEIVKDPAIDSECPPDTLYSVADSEGNISNQYMIPGHDVDQTFILTATGMNSSFSSQATFTNNLNSASPPAPETPSSALATVMTDKDDYVPGDVVQITGSGWLPGETVELYLEEEPLIHDPETLYAIADENGNIYAEYVVQEHDLGQAFTLTATGLTSGLTAQTTFTDAGSTISQFSFTGIPTGSTVAPGSALPWTARAICTQNATQCQNDGTTLNGPVPDGYQIIVSEKLKTGANCNSGAGVFVDKQTQTTTSGNAGGSFNAPTTAGDYCYRARHPNQTINLKSWGQTTHNTDIIITVAAATDTTPPTITCPANITEEADQAGGKNVNYIVPTATDDTDPDPTESCSPTSGSLFPLGSTTVTCTATDAAGNSAQCTFDVTVQDTTPPDITCPADVTKEGNTTGGFIDTAYTVPTATDIVDASPDVSCVPANNSMFNLRTSSVTCTATDDAGNSASCSFDVTVQDTTAPDITCPGAQTLEGNVAGGYQGMAYTDATATDIVDASPDVSCVPPNNSMFNLGTTGVTCTATDDAGNSAQCSFNVTVVDTTPPNIACPADITLEGNTTGGFQGTAYTVPTATDIVDPNPTESCSPAPGDSFSLGTNLVSCTATDASGNSASCPFNVTVQDTTPPTISCPADITGTVGQVVNLGSPTVSDIVDPNPTVGNNDQGTFPPGKTNVTWTATDVSGNSASCVQMVTLTYIFMGFFPPVDNLPVVNLAKAGQGIPFKWVIKDANGNYISDLSTVVSYGYGSVACMNGTTDAIESYETAGNSGLRWDPVEMQFIFTSKTLKNWAGYCKTFTLNLDDGTMHKANFKFK